MEIVAGRSKLKELEDIIAEYQDQLFRFAFSRTHCFAISQDIVQMVFIRLHHDNADLSAIRNMKGYLYKSISNACIDYKRKNEDAKFISIDEAQIPADLHAKDASYELMLAEEYNRIELLLREVPEEQAETIRYRVFDNLSFVEIASILDVPVTTIKSRFKYGIDQLKTIIGSVKEGNHGLR